MCARSPSDRRSWISASESRPECRRQSRRSSLSSLRFSKGSTAMLFSGNRRCADRVGFRENNDEAQRRSRASTSNAIASFRPAHIALRCFFSASNFFGSCRIADFIGVEIHNADAHAVFHFAFAKIVQDAAASAGIAPGLRRHVWRAECVRHRRNPSPAARC